MEENQMTDAMSEMLGKAKMAADMYRIGQITRESAVDRIKPYADAFNAKAADIAKKFNRRPQRFSIASFLR
jgi:hypothetical protein